MASKTKTGLSQTPLSKPSANTARGKSGSSSSLKSDTDSPSTIPRFSIDRSSPKPVTSIDRVSPKPVTSIDRVSPKPVTSVDRVSPKPVSSIDRVSPKSVISKPTSRSSPRLSAPDKSQPRINKPSELQAQLQASQDDLKKAKEKLVLAEKEKSQALSDLKAAKKLADEANEKLEQALVAQKRAEESSEIDKFRAVELEQAGIESVQKKEADWKKELESVRSQLLSSEDKSSFLSTTEELQSVKQELAMVIDTKNQAIANADDATKISQIHAKQVELLSAELARLKGLLESKAENEQPENPIVADLRSELIEKEKSYENNVSDLKSELESVREELDKANTLKNDLIEKEKLFEKTIAEMTSELALREQDLEKAKICERDLIEKEKTLIELNAELASLEQLLKAKTYDEGFTEENSYEKSIAELKSNLDFLKEDLEKTKASEQDLVARNKSLNVIVAELNSEIDSVRVELQKAKGLEEKFSEKEALYEETITGLKSELEKTKSTQEEMIERETVNEKTVKDLELKLHALKQEVQVSENLREKLTEMEESYEQMNIELEAARMAESYALNSLNEWKRKSEELESKVTATTRLERSTSESLGSVMKQLEGNSDALHDAECEVSDLKEKVSLLEISLVNRKKDLEVSESRLRKANEDANEFAKVIESVRAELETVKEEKALAMEHEKSAASSVQDLLEEKNNLINEVERLKEEEEKSKMAMESLASALHEVSAEVRVAKERLVLSQVEHENFETQIEHLQLVVKSTSEKYETMLEDSRREIDRLNTTMEQSKVELDIQMEDLKIVLKASNDKYESMLDELKHEIDRLMNTLEKSKVEHENEKAEWEAKEMRITEQLESTCEESKAEWEQKELQLVNGLKRSEDEKMSMEKEIMRLVHLLSEAEEEAHTIHNERSQLKQALEEAEANCLKLKENLQGSESGLQNITAENKRLRSVEAACTSKIEELTKVLEEASNKVHQQSTENGELSDSDKDYDLLPKVVGFSEENGHLGEKKIPQKEGLVYPEKVDGKSTISESKETVKDETSDSEAKMWESYKVDRDFSAEMETEHGSLDDEAESRADNTESLDLHGTPSENGSNSDSKHQKKKKPLYRKFGNLLKKGISNPK